MIVADILMWFLLIIGTYIVIISYWLTTQGLFSAFVARCRHRYQSRPFRHAAIGFAVTIPAVVAGIRLLQAPNPAVKILGAAVLLLTILMGLMGSAGLASHVGTGLGAEEEWRRVFHGGIALGLTFILPGVGWFLVLPLTLVMGVAATVLSLRVTPRS